VIDAVRVPPSASMTSQSIQIVRSPRARMSVTARRLRPIEALDLMGPAADLAARRLARDAAGARPGSMPYSAVTQPRPLFLRKGGTLSSTDAVQMTRVRPTSISTDPSAWR
jgi:hypothetical protein